MSTYPKGQLVSSCGQARRKQGLALKDPHVGAPMGFGEVLVMGQLVGKPSEVS